MIYEDFTSALAAAAKEKEEDWQLKYDILTADYEQKWGLSNRLSEQIAALTATSAEQAEEIERLRKGRDAVYNLIAQSHGVIGLHRNGDTAPWDELLAGGRFEEWLLPLSESLKKANDE